MKFTSVRDLREKTSALWSSLPEDKEIVVTSNGHPIALLSYIPENQVEETLAAIRQARAAISVSRMQTRSGTSGKTGLTLTEINTEIKAARKKQRSA